jgi:undecaprenyl-diphosphatase
MSWRSVIESAKKSARPLIVQGGILFAAVALFLALAEEVWERETLAFDNQVTLALIRFSSPWLDRVMAALTLLGAQMAVLLTVLIGGGLWWLGRKRDALFTLSAIGGAVMLSLTLKLLFQRPRPTLFTPLQVETSFSFPSGHTLAAVGLYGFVAMLLWRSGRRAWGMLVGVVPVAVGISRIYLGVHYPSDVLASLAVGVAWLVLVGWQLA